jgi:hypothetical protein
MLRHSLRTLLLGAAVAALVAGTTSSSPAQSPPPAPEQPGSIYDPQQLPVTKGSVARYSLSPRGDVDGLILTDGTEVHLPPHLSTQLVYAVKPGDAVSVHGLKALRLPLVAAVSVTNDGSGQTVVDDGPPAPPGPKGPRDTGRNELSTLGRVQMALHGPRGEITGALLEDGTFLRLPPPEAERLARLLAPGQTVAAQGPGLRNALGTVIDVRQIGPSQDQLTEVAPPPPRGPKGHRPPPPPPAG